jgi:hypothetical protein
VFGEETLNARFARYPSSDALLRLAGNPALDENSRRTLNGERLARGARRFIVRVMEIDSTPLCMRNRAGLVPGKRQRRTYQSGLAEQRQNHGAKPKPA